MWSNRGDFVERGFLFRALENLIWFVPHPIALPRSPKEQIVRNEVQERKPLTIGYWFSEDSKKDSAQNQIRVQRYYFFLTWQWVGSDCVRYWSGLRASAPMIGQSKKKSRKKTQGVTEATLVTMPNMIKFNSSYTNYFGYSLYKIFWGDIYSS